MLKSAAREGGVSAATFANFDTLWGLRCDGTLNEEEYSSLFGELRFIPLLQSDASGSKTAPLPWPQPLASPTPPNAGRA